MTGTTPMRERMIEAAAQAIAYSDSGEGARIEATDEYAATFAVDAVLDVLGTPSDDMLLAGKSAWAEGGGWIETYAAMIKSIRGGD